MKSILGRKVGMTQIFLANGNAVPVTAVECFPNLVLQRKTKAIDGYSAIKLGFMTRKNANKSELGMAKKAGSETAKRFVREVVIPESIDIKEGSTIPATIFTAGESIVVSGVTIGKGFQGAIKRHGFSTGPKTHGSKNHRITGTQGAMDRGGRIPLGQKKPGHMGMDNVTICGLKVVEVMSEQNVILVSGAIPGPKNGLVVISNRNAEYDTSKITQVIDTKKEEVPAV